MQEQLLIEPDLKFIREVKRLGGESLKKCYQCATCSAVCNLSPATAAFPRKEMILAQWGQRDKLMSDPDIWLCYQCNDCSTYCPRGAKPGDVLAAVRSYVYESHSFPSFMGKALANPKALPLLFLVPMIVILAMMLTFTGANFSFMSGTIEFAKFLPHGWIEVMFMGGNALIFLFAGIGLWRFWNGLHSISGSESGPGFISSLILAVKDIVLHSSFNECQANKPRYLAHALVFFGFIGAMITAGLAVLALVLFNYGSPIPMTNPIKWLGNVSALSGFVGLTILVYRRFTQKDNVGANGYSDWLFLIVLYFVFITGWLSQFLRLADASVAAYSLYYIHLVVIFFLLWYAPYSKFAHMFYRTLALTYARSIGRKQKS